jgi:hypothetical protein
MDQGFVEDVWEYIKLLFSANLDEVSPSKHYACASCFVVEMTVRIFVWGIEKSRTKRGFSLSPFSKW